MMQFEVVKMYGYTISLLKPIEIHDDEKVNFFYNYFEDNTWEMAGYDASNAKFYSDKIGGYEFYDVIL